MPKPIPPGVSSGLIRAGANALKHQSTVTPEGAQAKSPNLETTLTQGETQVSSTLNARSLGFTGDTCQSCGSVRMVNSGTCHTCLDCGSTSGCS